MAISFFINPLCLEINKTLSAVINYMALKKNDLILTGIAACPGIIIGKAFMVYDDTLSMPVVPLVTEGEIHEEIYRFKQTLNRSPLTIRC